MFFFGGCEYNRKVYPPTIRFLPQARAMRNRNSRRLPVRKIHFPIEKKHSAPVRSQGDRKVVLTIGLPHLISLMETPMARLGVSDATTFVMGS